MLIELDNHEKNIGDLIDLDLTNQNRLSDLTATEHLVVHGSSGGTIHRNYVGKCDSRTNSGSQSTGNKGWLAVKSQSLLGKSEIIYIVYLDVHQRKIALNKDSEATQPKFGDSILWYPLVIKHG